MKAKFERYGLLWPDGTTDLQVEFQMIRKGGSGKDSSGNEKGLGLFEHYMNARKLLWPDRYRHRWTDLMYREFIGNSVTVLMGAGSTQKTSHASEFALINYWLHPKETLVILSTTTVAKLEMAVFGEIKKLWQEARDRWGEYLAGNPVDSKHAIATDAVEEGQIRDLRKGVVGVACYVGKQFVGLGSFAGIKQKRMLFLADELQFMSCFTRGTLVDTAFGKVPIESVAIGDEVVTAVGFQKVRGTINQPANSLVTVHTLDSRKVICTPNHRFLTQKGWVSACNLNEEHYILSPYEAMLYLRQGVRWTKDLHGMSCQSNKEVRVVSEGIQIKPTAFSKSFLRSILLGEVENKPTVHTGEGLHQRAFRESIGVQKGVVEVAAGFEEQHGYPNAVGESNAQLGILHQGGGLDSKNWMPPSGSRRKRNRTNEIGMAIDADVSGGCLELRHQNRNEGRERLSNVLQGGLSVPGQKAGHRGRRSEPQQPEAQIAGQEEGEVSCGSWVDRVEIHKQGDPEFAKSGGNSQECTVYNLEVEGHPSYSVSGLLVHNCTFLECLPNMFQGCESLKVIGSGNPKHDPLDQLGRAAEPKAGWESLGDIKKTTVWETKFLNGRCVNLVGTDSPNFDHPEDQPTAFKGLVSWKTVASVAAFWGKDSLEYSKQCLGTMRIGMIGNRVITAALCKQHKAQDRALWESTNRTRIYACDPAWGGINADRCVAGWGEFGIDKDGIQILRVNQPVVVPIIAASSVLPDDQIAHFIRRDTERLSIEPEDIFYDSTGRGTTGSAFARIFGQRVPVPIAFGDRPSRRPVRHDLFVIEPDGSKRLKRCDEYYQKFVTELWFSVRYIIECDQMRELPDDVMMEGTMREYKTVAGGKIEVESKDDTRERMGCSPDLFDWLAILVEGARQRGFKIQRLGVTMTEEEDSHGWMYEEEEAYHDVLQEAMLTH